MEPVSEEIIAWRGWRLVHYDDGWRLHSITKLEVCWDGPTLVADKVPKRNTAHGIYALNNRELVVSNSYQGHCLGEVALSGVVVEGSNGYRAEKATIRSLILMGWLDPNTRPIEIMTDLEERYQCEVSWEQEVPMGPYGNTLMQLASMPSVMTQVYAYQQSAMQGLGGFGGLGNAIGLGGLGAGNI